MDGPHPILIVPFAQRLMDAFLLQVEDITPENAWISPNDVLQTIYRRMLEHFRPAIVYLPNRVQTRGAYLHGVGPQWMTQKESLKLRPHQQRCVDASVMGGCVHSGMIRVPCGGGKTAIGLCIASRARGNVLIVTSSHVSSGQWHSQLRDWFDVRGGHIVTLDESMDMQSVTVLRERVVQNTPTLCIATYTRLTASQKHTAVARCALAGLKAMEYQVIILDEAQCVPADCFRRVAALCYHSIIGLSATFMREDNKQQLFERIIGPMLIDIPCSELVDASLIARVDRHTLIVPYPQCWKRLSLSYSQTQLACVINPFKLNCVISLLRYHLGRGEHIMVFCDNLAALHEMHRIVSQCAGLRAFGPLCMRTANRNEMIQQFRRTEPGAVLFVSKVGDIAIDIPEVSVLIQTSTFNSSRNQAAQRDGRAARICPGGASEASTPNTEVEVSHSYSIVGEASLEIAHSDRREAHMAQQGSLHATYRATDADLPEHVRKALDASDAEEFETCAARMIPLIQRVGTVVAVTKRTSAPKASRLKKKVCFRGGNAPPFGSRSRVP